MIFQSMGNGSGQKSERRRVLECLTPFLFPAIGFILGVVLSIFLPSGAWWSLASKLLMFCYGLIGWALGVCFVQQKRLYCGATETISNDEWPVCRERYCRGAGIVIAVVFYGRDFGGGGFGKSKFSHLRLLHLLRFASDYILCSGRRNRWGDPWKFFKMFAGMRKK